MKKALLIALFSLLQVPLFANLSSQFDTLLQSDKEKYNDLVGYNLDMQVWPETRKNVEAGLPTLSVHGFGASPTSMVEWTRNAGPNKIPGDIVTFRFADAANDDTMPDFSQLNLGQNKDILSLLTAFKAMKDVTKNSGWNTHGQSRGAATIVNTLAVLNQPVDIWHDTLKKSLITEEERVILLESVKKGAVILETPLVTTASGIHGNGKLVIKKHVGVDLPDIIASPLSGVANYIGFPLVSYGKGNYSPWGAQASSSVDNLPEGLKVLVHYQKNDKDVSNDHDQSFTEKLMQRLGKNNVWTVLGNDGGKPLDDETWYAVEKAKEQGIVSQLKDRAVRAHNAGPETLLKKGVISAFYKKHGGAYVNDEAHLAQGEKILDLSHTCSENVTEYFKDYDVNDTI